MILNCTPLCLAIKYRKEKSLTYVESKQAKVTRRRLKEFLISLRERMNPATMFPKMPKIPTIV